MALDFEKTISNLRKTGETSAVNEPEKFEACTCKWENGQNFIPNQDCPVHGKKTRELLKQQVSYGGKGSKMPKFDLKKFKNWAIWIVVAIFGAVIAWRLNLKFI